MNKQICNVILKVHRYSGASTGIVLTYCILLQSYKYGKMKLNANTEIIYKIKIFHRIRMKSKGPFLLLNLNYSYQICFLYKITLFISIIIIHYSLLSLGTYFTRYSIELCKFKNFVYRICTL